MEYGLKRQYGYLESDKSILTQADGSHTLIKMEDSLHEEHAHELLFVEEESGLKTEQDVFGARNSVVTKSKSLFPLIKTEDLKREEGFTSQLQFVKEESCLKTELGAFETWNAIVPKLKKIFPVIKTEDLKQEEGCTHRGVDFELHSEIELGKFECLTDRVKTEREDSIEPDDRLGPSVGSTDRGRPERGNRHAHGRKTCAQIRPHRTKNATSSKQHLSTRQSPHKCALCESSFSSACSLKRHMLRHSSDKPFCCEQCGYESHWKHNLDIHVARRHGGQKAFGCAHCSYRYCTRRELIRHLNWNHSIDVTEGRGDSVKRGRKYRKKYRKRALIDPQMVRSEMDGGRTIHRCEICPYKTVNRGDIRNHIMTHTGQKPFKCNICASSFVQSGHLNRHMLTHSREKPYRCSVCVYSCNQAANIKRHMLTHIEKRERNYSSNLCAVELSSAVSLKHQMGDRTLKPYVCDICSRGFSSTPILNRHMKIHSEEKPYKCHICSFKSTRSDDLKRHIFTHSSDKPFRCDQCGHKCTLKRNLSVHIMRKHSRKKPYGCAHCQHRTASKGELITHLLRHH